MSSYPATPSFGLPFDIKKPPTSCPLHESAGRYRLKDAHTSKTSQHRNSSMHQSAAAFEQNVQVSLLHAPILPSEQYSSTRAPHDYSIQPPIDPRINFGGFSSPIPSKVADSYVERPRQAQELHPALAGKSVHEARTLAKSAVDDLTKHSIKLDMLSRELGQELSLKDLFLDPVAPLYSSSTDQLVDSSSFPQSPTKASFTNPLVTASTTNTKTPEVKASPKSTQQELSTRMGNILSKPVASTGDSRSNKVTIPVPAQESDGKAAQTVPPLNHISVTPSAVANSTEDRKAKIARLFAEKTGKQVTIAKALNADVPSKVTTNTSLKMTDHSNTKRTTTPTVPVSRLEAKPDLQSIEVIHAPGSFAARPNEDLNGMRSNVATLTPQPAQILSAPSQRESSPDLPIPIPGLFMTSPAPRIELSSQVQQFGMPHPSQLQTRKRPVAADFNEGPSSSMRSHKKPFGQGRNDTLVIDVSDEDTSESDGEGVDGATVLDRPQSASHGTKHDTDKNKSPLIRRNGIRDFPPLTDSSARSKVVGRTVPMSPRPTSDTPPITLTGLLKSQLDQKRQEEVKEKLAKIAEMKRKIAEMEARKARARESGHPTPIATPAQLRSQESTPPRLVGSTIAPVTNTPVSSDLAHPSDTNSPRPASPRASITATPELLVDAERQKRREELRSRLSSFKSLADEAERKAREHQLEQRRWEAVHQENLMAREKLVEELKSLGLPINEDNIAELQIEKKKTELSDLKIEVAETQQAMNIDVSEQPDPNPRREEPILEPALESVGAKGAEKSPYSSQKVLNGHTPSLFGNGPKDEDNREEQPFDEQSEQSEAGDTMDLTGSITADIRMSSVPTTSGSPFLSDVVNSDINGQGATHSVLLNRLRTPDQTPKSSSGSFNGDSQSQNKEDGELDNEGHSYDTDSSYEPPSVHSPAPNSKHPSVKTKLLEYNEDHASTDGNSINVDPIVPNPNIISTLRGIQPIQAMAKANYSSQTAAGTDDPFHPFQRYESPLRQLRAYRNHPNFLTDVVGGFQSLTFINDIKPSAELCRFETSGGVCNDLNCSSQHFRQMTLSPESGDKILLDLTKDIEGQSPEKMAEFKEGAKRLISNLQTKQQPFPIVAKELTAYRRRYVNDHTKLLMSALK
ncbi:MAG: hypothetical protein M1824_003089 [Vezdaea acicularis]|nr:MAG: hypothetical protein M1824_003089 [Vezdaea acicularis]